MVKAAEGPRAAERRLILSYAPADARAGLAALLALDDTLGQVLRTTREPLVGQMRLTWWHDALARLDAAPPPAEPMLQALAASVLPVGVSGAALADMVEGWEALLEDDPLAAVAEKRGAGLFAAAARVLGQDDPRVAAAGRGWALADVSRGLSDPAVAAAARRQVVAELDAALVGRWPVRLRPLGALALTARFDVAEVPVGSPRRVARLAWHRLSGR